MGTICKQREAPYGALGKETQKSEVKKTMADCSNCPSVPGSVRIGSWQHPRRYIARPCGVAVEIGLEGCDCPTCRARVDSCKSTLEAKGVEFESIPVGNGGLFFALPGAVESPAPEVVSFFLAEKLDLAVVPA